MAGHLLGSITPSQAWAILQRHARDEIAPLRLRELCRDNDRVSSLVAVYNSTTETTQTQTDGSAGSSSSSSDHTIIVDLSRQHMTDATLNHLLNLAASQQLKPFITRIAWGQNNPRRPVQPSSAIRRNNKNANKKNKKQPKVNMPNHLKEFQMAAALQPVTGAGAAADTDDDPSSSMMPSMHLALRVPPDKGYIMLAAADGTNVLTGIHQEWHRIERFAESVRRGQLRGGSGQMLRDIVVVGRGTAVAALQFVYAVLQKDERAVIASRFGLASDQHSNRMRLANLTGGGQHPASNSAHVSGRRILFLTSLDPNAAAALTADLDPATTLVVSIALQGNEETGLVTSALKNWLLKSSLGNNNRKTESVLSKHMILITGNDRVATVINKPESVYVIPAHSRCEAFTSFSVATLLPLSVVFGWSLVQDFLAGGHDMDTHFVETNPRHNVPVLLALADVWNDAFLDATARAVIPFTESLAAFPAFVGALESQTCGQSPATETRHSNSLRNHSPMCSSMVLDGRLDGSLDRSFYQSGKIINSELVIATDSQIRFNAARSIGAHGMEAVQTAQDALMCSFFAHADELAFGVQATQQQQQQQQQHPTPTAATTADYSFSSSAVSVSPNTAKTNLFGSSSDLSRGNRPSVLLMCGKLDAFTCGQLVALTEHRAVVKAHLWGVDPFVRQGGSSLRRDRTDELKSDLGKLFTSPPDAEEEEDGDDGEEGHLSFSTKTLLSHYANRMRNERNS